MQRFFSLIDDTLGRWLRHFAFLLVRPYFGLFYNVSCSGKHLLQEMPGGLILASHVSRLDGPLLASVLYTTMRVRPAVHYNEYYSALQWVPMALAGSIPLSSPKSWEPERRAAQKVRSLERVRQVIRSGNLVLLFPGGMSKRQPREVIQPHFSGAYDTLKAIPDCPVVLVRIRGLSRFDQPIHDRFWTFLGIRKGRRHVEVEIDLIEDGLDTSVPLAQFNADLEDRLNAENDWPQIAAD